MSFDSVTEAAARRLARPHTRRKALRLLAGAAASVGLGLAGLASRASAASGTLTLVNQTGQTIWPGVAGSSVPNGGGWELAPGATTTVGVPANWSGRIWARTNCNFGASGSGSCETGDCGGVLACNGATGAASATLAEFSLGGGSSLDYYDVSLVDAFNVPITITPQGGAGCGTAGCTANLDPGCPAELQDVDSSGNIVACLSACSKFGGDQYCCTGSSGSPAACSPADWQVDSASYFKSACPDAYSYAFDSVTSLFTCQGASSYLITFLPFGGSGGAQSSAPPAPAQPAPAPSTSPSPAPASCSLLCHSEQSNPLIRPQPIVVPSPVTSSRYHTFLAGAATCPELARLRPHPPDAGPHGTVRSRPVPCGSNHLTANAWPPIAGTVTFS